MRDNWAGEDILLAVSDMQNKRSLAEVSNTVGNRIILSCNRIQILDQNSQKLHLGITPVVLFSD
jgi:predicted secreted protein